MSLMAGLAAAILSATAAATPAAAFGDHVKVDPFRAPEGFDRPPVIDRAYRPHGRYYYQLGAADDPYAYRYAKRKYYPYHNSQYWVPAAEMRYRYRYSFYGPKYVYHPAWGLKKPEPREHHDVKPSK
jgi:hypothetical protein